MAYRTDKDSAFDCQNWKMKETNKKVIDNFFINHSALFTSINSYHPLPVFFVWV